MISNCAPENMNLPKTTDYDFPDQGAQEIMRLITPKWPLILVCGGTKVSIIGFKAQS